MAMNAVINIVGRSTARLPRTFTFTLAFYCDHQSIPNEPDNETVLASSTAVTDNYQRIASAVRGVAKSYEQDAEREAKRNPHGE